MYERPLTETVSVIRCWLAMSRPDDADCLQPSYKAYLIRPPQQAYVGIVLDHGPPDLHVFMNPAHRGQYYLSTALREVILPHLLQDRDVQQITISRNSGRATFEAAWQAARGRPRAAGFVPVAEREQAEENVATLQYRPAEPAAHRLLIGHNATHATAPEPHPSDGSLSGVFIAHAGRRSRVIIGRC